MAVDNVIGGLGPSNKHASDSVGKLTHRKYLVKSKLILKSEEIARRFLVSLRHEITRDNIIPMRLSLLLHFLDKLSISHIVSHWSSIKMEVIFH